MRLKELTLDDLYAIAEWRNKDIRPFRTPRKLTDRDQERYFERLSTDNTLRMHALIGEVFLSDETRFIDEYGIHDPEVLIGYGGIENIDWYNRTAEISLFIRPELRGNGYGKKAVNLILNDAFCMAGIHTVWGEAYSTTDAYMFWEHVIQQFGGSVWYMNDRKFYDNRWYNALGFDITVERFKWL